MERGLDELDRQLHHHRHAETAGAYARQQQPANSNARTSQMTIPTRETRRARRANGRPRSQPMGRHLQSESQHMSPLHWINVGEMKRWIYLPLLSKRKRSRVERVREGIW
ncbi:hypothetical protein HPP92_022982 [Vanilla planifolia]|uniref:Uncharacterized protein n=1 Tax=Vanilla planifolia TaxID=51239 RepID=A0A835PYG8_VANPL|nr:hypothetical protein HPP92_023247 [Vanilla planifolia]KAG0459854.1 hypothetical protein HPP92_022982 [Vanilla planifolia]